ncbi:MAG: Uma2 family endonuclease [Dehalococcoidia bacterium]
MAIRRNVRFKAEDIWDTPDDGNRYEVIDGALFMTPPPGWGHQRGLGRLYIRVGNHVYAHGLGEVVQAPIGVVLDDENGVEPDLVFVAKERMHIVAERGVFGAPDLVAEVLSPRTRSRDLGIKKRRYAAAGIPHYWVLDPRPHTLTAFRLGTGGYEEAGRFAPGDIFRPLLFPASKSPPLTSGHDLP